MKLQKLRLWCMKMDPDGLRHLAGVRQIKSLDLTFMFQLEKQPEPWVELAKFKHLELLDLTRIGRVEPQVVELSKSLPDCKIVR